MSLADEDEAEPCGPCLDGDLDGEGLRSPSTRWPPFGPGVVVVILFMIVIVLDALFLGFLVVVVVVFVVGKGQRGSKQGEQICTVSVSSVRGFGVGFRLLDRDSR